MTLRELTEVVGVEPSIDAVASLIFVELTVLLRLCTPLLLPRRSTTHRWDHHSGTRRVDRQSL